MTSALRIGFDARALTPPRVGTGVYLGHLLARAAELAPSIEWLAYGSGTLRRIDLPSERIEPRPAAGRGSRWGSVWLQTALPSAARRDGLDLFWGPNQVLPLRLIGSLPTLVTLHDLVFHRYAHTMSWRNRLTVAPVVMRSLLGADRVLAVSETTARAAVVDLGLPAEKVKVVRNGVRADFAPSDPSRSRSRVAHRFGIERDFVLFVGTFEPRKNLGALLDAIASLRDAGRFDGQLVLVGGSGWKSAGLESRLADPVWRSTVVRPGYVEPEALPDLYSAARLFVMPSLYEGFGIPVLEAMACGTAVVCSDREPFREVAGDAARLVSLERPGDLREAIGELWLDSDLRSRLAAKGPERARLFSWRDSAQRLLEIIEQVAGRAAE